MRASCRGCTLILQKSSDFRWSLGGKKLYSDHTALAQSLNHHHGASVLSPHEGRMISVWNLTRLHGIATSIAWFPYDLCTVPYGFARPVAKCPYKKLHNTYTM